MRQPPIRYIDRITGQYEALGYGRYNWLHNETPSSVASLSKPLSESRLGLLATGGVYQVGMTGFTHKDDTTYRAIAADVAADQLRATHFAYDLTDARTDINVVFPIDALRSLVDQGVVGELAPHLFTCMGGIYSQRRVREELAPAIVERAKADEIDVMLLVPV